MVNDIEHFGELRNYARSVHSQAGEDGIIKEIFKRLNITQGTFIDVGSWDGKRLSNTKELYDKNWLGIYIEGHNDKINDLKQNVPNGKIFHEYITLGRLNEIAKELNIDEIDLLNIDIDGNDYWIWKSFNINPKLVVIEYNCNLLPSECKTIVYDPDYRFTETNYFGASAGALNKLAEKKGYTLIACSDGLNLFFIRNDFKDKFTPMPIDIIPTRQAFHVDRRKMIDV